MEKEGRVISFKAALDARDEPMSAPSSVHPAHKGLAAKETKTKEGKDE